MYMIFASLAPVFLIILAGFLIERLSYLPASTGDILSFFSLNICIPCLLFHIMCGTTMEQFSQVNWWGGMIGVQVGCFFLFYWIERRLRHSESGPATISALSASFCNAGFVGISVIISLFPGNAEAMSAAGLTVITSNIIVIIGQMLMLGWSRQRRMPQGRHMHFAIPLRLRIWRFVRRFLLGNPILMATALGLACAFLEIPVWKPLDQACAMLGYVSPTCMLFTLGFSLRKNLAEAFRGHSINVKHQVMLMSWRLLGMPLLLLLVLVLLNCPPLWISVSVIMMATGSAIMVSALSQVYQAVPGQAALTVAVTNILSFFSLLAAIWLLTITGLMPASAASL